MAIASTSPGKPATPTPAPTPATDTAAALSPWPATTAPVSRAAAIARLKAAIAGRAAQSDSEADALGAMASARVEKVAPGAPQAVKDEAVIRYAGYMAQADYGTIRQETIGPKSTEFAMNHAAAFRLSGAYGLLSPWAIRRAGVIA